MPNNAEIIKNVTVLETCRKILSAIQNNCENLKDVEDYVKALIEKEEKRYDK